MDSSALHPRTWREPIVITGIGLIASVGRHREAVWRAVCGGKSGMRWLRDLPGFDEPIVAAPVDLELPQPGLAKGIALALVAAEEAIRDARIATSAIDSRRFGCAVGAQMGDTYWLQERDGRPSVRPAGSPAWWTQWLPNSACGLLANRFGILGPRMCHSTACATGLIEVLCAVRAIDEDRCDVALVGSAEAIEPLLAAGFQAMRVLARHDDPQQACRPFDVNRSGFVMGEGAAMFVIERLSHAERRGAHIYAEIAGGKMLSAANHVTGLEGDGEALTRLISQTLRQARLAPEDLDYINAHGTGTRQNDPLEIRAIRQSLGRAASGLCVSSTKSMLGHLVNAAGSVELAIATLALRDGFVPPTINLTEPDPECDLDCIPLVGRRRQCETALKLSVAFGGHLAAVALRRWNAKAARTPQSVRLAA